jgi:hypothetical protein
MMILSNGALMLYWCIRPFWFWDLGSLHRYHTVGTTSQHCSSSVAISIAA